ncbi:hypothetical protein PsorP6_007360 [Peronosclerospora sorghi]|uniref:Uncharacterized protein n=1 Tax=Peronosclerospora sorghi TaxID=230839 RepID=A0ACC0W9D7_9STRA|nr:hypothetical protein PsorP6_007360 [Peronosclerospora sorghi]
MPPPRSFMSFTVRCFETPLTVDQVHISLSSRFNGRPHPDARIEATKQQIWAHRQQQSPTLFNATKFRLEECTVTGTKCDPRASVTMRWGLTDYATYVATCCSSLTPRLLRDGERLHDNPWAFCSRKVGVAAALETTDGYVALLQRSTRVGAYPNLCDTPGGHPEPHKLLLTTESLDSLEDNNEHTRKQLEFAARREFFESITNEVHEEVNVAPALQHPPTLLGIVFQTDACTPSFAFHIRTKCTAHELEAFYRAGPADEFESTALQLVTVESLLAHGATAVYEKNVMEEKIQGVGVLLLLKVCALYACRDKLELTPSAKGTLDLWKRHTLRAR